MPLYIQQKTADINVLNELDAFIKKYGDIYKDKAERLKNMSVLKMEKDDMCLFVGQREICTVGLFDNIIKMIGTDMMTTCHAAVLQCPVTSATSLGHFDGTCTETGVMEMVTAVNDASLLSHPDLANCQERKFELHLVGGFDDDRGLSSDLSIALLNGFHNLHADFCGRVKIHLKTFCCTSLNSMTKMHCQDLVHSPVVYGLGVNIARGDIFPLEFDEDARCPAAIVRAARTFHGHGKMVNMYRWSTGRVVIEPFTYKPFPNALDWLELPDDIIKQHMSTSPDVEPPNFMAHIRQTLHFIASNPQPLSSTFKAGKPLCYHIVDKHWKEIDC